MIPAIAASPTLVAVAGPAVPAPALPDAVAAMLDEAGSDTALLQKIAEIAKPTHPDARSEIDARVAVIPRASADARTLEMASLGAFDGWGGSGEIGAFASSGNTSNSGVALAGRLVRQGPRWRHAMRGAIDYQQEAGKRPRNAILPAMKAISACRRAPTP